jgi:diacylglycerol O-acyltransferase 2, plant
MYLSDPEKECIYFKKRTNTIKAAIEEGCDIYPAFFFGNTSLFTTVGAGGKSPTSKLFAKLSRSLRMSVIFFYGRFFLPIPYRHPIKMVTGVVVKVEQSANPTEAQIKEVQDRVIQSITDMYNSSGKKPDWELRPLVII